jgi:hypothetical protein
MRLGSQVPVLVEHQSSTKSFARSEHQRNRRTWVMNYYIKRLTVAGTHSYIGNILGAVCGESFHRISTPLDETLTHSTDS